MKAIELANYILGYCQRNNIEDCTPKKMQKLLYYVYVWYLLYTGNKIINEKFFAWLHGPVVAEVYGKYKEYGYHVIPFEDEYRKDYDKLFSDEDKEIVSCILDSYSNFTADKLEEKTHREEPWIKARMRDDFVIDDQDIMKFYSKVWNDSNSENKL